MDAMTMQRFAQLADAWGGDITRWPPVEQPAAARVLASAEGDMARSLLAEAGELDRALRSVVPAPPSMRLRDAILAGVPSDPPQVAPDNAESDSAVLGYEARWFPRAVPAPASPHAQHAREHSARMHPARPSKSGFGRRGTARLGGIGRVWHELGGVRVAGPALAAALVLGVALAEVRSPGPLDPGVPGSGAVAAGNAGVLDAALLDAGYEEYLL